MPGGEVPSALPPRFVLLEDGQVFVGGTSQIAAGRLDKAELKDLEQRLALVRKLPGLAARDHVRDAATPRYRLQSLQEQARRRGDRGPRRGAARLAAAGRASPRPRRRSTTASLRPYEPASFLLLGRGGSARGGLPPVDGRRRRSPRRSPPPRRGRERAPTTGPPARRPLRSATATGASW